MAQNLIASVGYENKLQFWNFESGTLHPISSKFETHLECVVKMKNEGNDIMIGVGGWEGSLYQTSLNNTSKKTKIDSFFGSGTVQWLDYTTKSNLPLLCCGTTIHEEGVVLWKRNNKSWNVVWKNRSSITYCCRFYQQGNEILSTNSSYEIKIWNVERGQCIKILKGHNGLVNHVEYGKGGDLYSCSGDKRIITWDLRQKQKVNEISAGRMLFRLLFHENKSELIAGEYGNHLNFIQCWDLRTMKMRKEWSAHTESVRSIISIPQKNLILSCSRDNTIKVWNGETFDLIRKMKEKNQVLQICYVGKSESQIEFPQFSEEILEREEEERIEFLNKLSDLEVPLKNKTLHLWKSLFQNISASILSELSRSVLDVEEEVILKIMLSKKVKIPQNSLFDYFLFFKQFRMKKEMYFMIQKLSEGNRKIEDVCTLFWRICRIHENDNAAKLTKSVDILSGEKGIFSTPTFDHSMTLHLFDIIKDRENEVMNNRALLTWFGSAFAALENHRIGKILEHPDFIGTDKDELTSNNHIFKKMFEKREKTNVVLKTKAERKNQEESTPRFIEKEHRVHCEILILFSNFFYRMLHFGGSEMEQLKKTGSISVEFMSNEELKYLIELIYLNETSCVNLDVLFCLLKHCEMYHEPKKLKVVHEKIEEIVKKIRRKELIEILTRSGHVFENEVLLKLCTRVFLVHFSDEDELHNLIDRSIGQKEEFDRFHLLEEKVDKMEKRVDERFSRIEELLNGLISDSSGGRKRKREEDDDEEDEKEKEEEEFQEKKRRKKQISPPEE